MACLLLFGIQIACQMTFTSLGYAKASILVAVLRKFILLIPLIYILPQIFTGNQTTAVYMQNPWRIFWRSPLPPCCSPSNSAKPSSRSPARKRTPAFHDGGELLPEMERFSPCSRPFCPMGPGRKNS